MNQFTKKEKRNITISKCILILSIIFACALPFSESISHTIQQVFAPDKVVYAQPKPSTTPYSEAKSSTTTYSQQPTQPTDIRLLGLSEHAFHIEWTGDDIATHYRYYLNGKEIGTTSWNGLVQSGLEPNTAYEFEVRSENVYGHSATTVFSFKTKKSSQLANPHNVHKKGDIVSWDAVKGATHYIVTSYGKIVYEGSDITFKHAVSTSGKTEHYFVQAVNAKTTSTGTLASFDSDGYFVPTVPHKWVITSDDSNLSLRWTKGEGAIETVVYQNGKEVYKGDGTFITLHDIKADEWYDIALHSINPIGESEKINLRIQPKQFELAQTNQ